MDVSERLLQLLAALQGGRAHAGADLARRLDVSPRTLRRDIDRLRDYGYPIRTRPGPGGYYQLGSGQALPPLVLSDDEAIATVIALSTLAADAPASAAQGGVADAAGRALGKIDALLPARLRSKAAALRATTEAERPARPEVAVPALGELAEAIVRTEAVAFDYTDAAGASTRRRVEPYRQINLDLTWYVLCWDLDRDDWRLFRTDRMTRLLRTGARFPARSIPAETALDFLRSGRTDAS